MPNIKLVIADRGQGKMGKSTSIGKTYLLLSKRPNVRVNPKCKYIGVNQVDFRTTIVINGIKVGFISQGDPGTNVPGHINDFVNNKKCDILLVACRNQGNTTDAVRNLRKLGFVVMWAPNGKCDDKACWDKLTDRYAEWMANVIEQCAINNKLDPAYL